MSKLVPNSNKKFSADWFVQGALTRIGDIFDRLTGRGWKPSSSLATSELAERLKALLDQEAKTDDKGNVFVPHLITLRMQWDKFSADSEMSIKKLENELLTAAVDHINDRHRYTYGPISVQVRSDYFTKGVTISAAFERAGGESEGELRVTLPDAKVSELLADVDADAAVLPPAEIHTTASFTTENRSPKVVPLHFIADQRLSVGRTKENDLMIDDVSVSKYHASLLMNAEGKYFVADTGSTNGTFVNGQRISYGKAVRIRENDAVRFGAVEVNLDLSQKPQKPEPAPTESYTVGGLEFTNRREEPDATVEAIDIDI